MGHPPCLVSCYRFVSSVPPWYIHATRPLNVHLLLALSGFWPCLGCSIAQHPNDTTCSHKQLPADCDPVVFPAWMRPFAQDSLLFRIWTTLWYSNGDSAGQWTPTQRPNISPVAALDVDFSSVYLAFNWSLWETLISQSCVSGKCKALQQVYWHVFRSTKSLCCPRHDLHLCCLQPQSKILEWVRRLELVKILYSSERRSTRTDTILKNPLHTFRFYSFKILRIFK